MISSQVMRSLLSLERSERDSCLNFQNYKDFRELAKTVLTKKQFKNN